MYLCLYEEEYTLHFTPTYLYICADEYDHEFLNLRNNCQFLAIPISTVRRHSAGGRILPIGYHGNPTPAQSINYWLPTIPRTFNLTHQPIPGIITTSSGMLRLATKR